MPAIRSRPATDATLPHALSTERRPLSGRSSPGARRADPRLHLLRPRSGTALRPLALPGERDVMIHRGVGTIGASDADRPSLSLADPSGIHEHRQTALKVSWSG